jgi:hypothetical protein
MRGARFRRSSLPAYPDDVGRGRALNDGVVCYLRKPVDRKHLIRCPHQALHSGEPTGEIHELLFRVRQCELKYGASRFIRLCPQSGPPWASMIDRQIDSPIPTPPRQSSEDTMIETEQQTLSLQVHPADIAGHTFAQADWRLRE